MGVLSSLYTPDRAQPRGERRENVPGWLARLFGDYGDTGTGINVNAESALKYTAVYCAIDLTSNTVAMLPLMVFQRDANGGKSRAPDHPVFDLIHRRPNDHMTAFVWRKTMQGNVMRWGNAYAEIKRTRMGGKPTGLSEPLPPNEWSPEMRGDGLFYVHQRRNSGIQPIAAENMLHIRTLGDGWSGKSPITLFRESIGLGMAAEKAGASFFGNGMHAGGLLKHPQHLSEEAQGRLRKSYQSTYGGVENTGKVLVLEEGMDFEPITIPPEDAQFLETRTFQVRDIARIFHVPPHKLADLADATFSNVEEQNIDFVGDCVQPWVVNWEQECEQKLLTEAERRRYFCEFVLEGLLRGNSQARAEFYSKGFQNGWFNINDIRQRENENPIGPAGDVHFVPVNLVPAEQALQNAQNPPENGPEPPSEPDEGGDEGDAEPDADEGDDERMAAHLALVEDACGRIVRESMRRTRSGLNKGQLDAEIANLEGDSRVEWAKSVLSPAIRACAESMGGAPRAASVDVYIGDEVRRHVEDVRAVCAGGDAARGLVGYEKHAPQAWARRILDDLRGQYGD